MRNLLKDLFFIPSPEFQEHNVVWKPKIYIYSLADASRNSYVRFYDELGKLGIQCSKFEPSLFYYQNNNSLDEILINHVVHCLGGTKTSEAAS